MFTAAVFSRYSPG